MKKQYIPPRTEIIRVPFHGMVITSGDPPQFKVGDAASGITEDDDINGSRRMRGAWDDDF